MRKKESQNIKKFTPDQILHAALTCYFSQLKEGKFWDFFCS